MGWGTSYKSDSAVDLIESGNTAAKRHTKDIHSEKYKTIFRENSLVLDSMLQWCRDRNVRLILFTPPAFVTYRQNLDEEQLKNTLDVAENMDAKYENCVFVNLLDDARFVAKDFFDADHLSDLGAKKLSLIMNEEVNRSSWGRELVPD